MNLTLLDFKNAEHQPVVKSFTLLAVGQRRELFFEPERLIRSAQAAKAWVRGSFRFAACRAASLLGLIEAAFQAAPLLGLFVSRGQPRPRLQNPSVP
jgi:hypothetical protein